MTQASSITTLSLEGDPLSAEQGMIKAAGLPEL